MGFEVAMVCIGYLGWVMLRLGLGPAATSALKPAATLALSVTMARRWDGSSDPISFFSPIAQIFFWLMVAGIVAFFMGFKWLRFKRRILDTPFSKMGSASIGLVEVSGKASGPRTIPAGLTGAACFYYRAMAWQRMKSGNQVNWQQVADESMAVPFFVEDSTGKLHVRPEGAEMEVLQTLKKDYDAHLYRGREAWPEPIRSFLARNAVDDSKDVRLEEHCIKPQETLFVIGTLGETPEMLGWEAQQHFGSKRTLQVQLNGPIVRTSKSSWKIERNPAAGGNDWTVTRSAGSPTGESVDVELLKKALGGLGNARTSTSVVVNQFAVNRTGGGSDRSSGGEAPDGASVATSLATGLPDDVLAEISKATGGAISPAKLGELMRGARGQGSTDGAVEEPLQLPRVGIGKGRRGDPFFISWRSQKDVAGTLGRRALACIYGGPVVAVICLYVLLMLLGKIPVGGPQ
jgi:hypothetical protein